MNDRMCGLYGRVSTVRQAQVVDGGLDTQFDLMERRIEWENDSDELNKWTVVDAYREEGFSGKDLERPEFKRMASDIEAGRINTVVVQKIDRITRSLRDFFELWEFFEKHGVQFISLHEKFDTTSAVGRAMLKLILVFAELEREQTSERTAATMSYRARQGLRNGGRIYGYELDPDNKGVLLVEPEQAAHVRHDFFEKCVELGSAGAVQRYLHQRGIITPEFVSRRGKTQGGKPFNKPAVIRMLTNPFYVGKISWKGEVFDGQHEPIVPDKLFEEVQRILGRNRKGRNNRKIQRQHLFILQGLMRCGRCGCMMTPRSSHGRGGKKYFYYECGKHARTQGLECNTSYVPAEPAEEFVIEQLKQAVLSEDEIRKVVEEANKKRSQTMKGLIAEETQAKKHLAQLRKKIEAIVSAVEEGKSFRAFSKRLQILEAEEEELTKALEAITLKKDKTEERLLSAEVMAENYRTVPQIIDELVATENWMRLKSVLSQYVDVIEWHEDEDDRRAGTVRIMLFEHAYPPDGGDGDGDGETRKKISASPSASDALSDNGWLP